MVHFLIFKRDPFSGSLLYIVYPLREALNTRRVIDGSSDFVPVSRIYDYTASSFATLARVSGRLSVFSGRLQSIGLVL